MTLSPAPGTPAAVQTHALLVQNDQLQLNIQRHQSTAQAALQGESGESGKFIPGYSLDDCQPIEEDAVRTALRWRERKDVSELKGRRVLVHLHAGTLWAVRL